MVQYSQASLDATFAALADPTRRAMLARLGDEGALTASELARPFSVSLPAVLKHIAVMAEAGLVRREKIGRAVHCRLEIAPVRQAMSWLEQTEKFWSARLDALAAFVEEEETWTPGRRASPSSAASAPAPKSSSARGRKARR
jgi:DNA-binding transcriptional ArsR family regulator